MNFAPKVRFTAEGAWLGMGTIHGLLRLEENAIALEYQIQDNVFNFFKSQISEKRLPIAEFERADFSNGWFGFFASITLTARRMAALEGIPGSDHGLLKLSLARRDRRDARELASQLNLLISEQILREEQAVVPAEGASAAEPPVLDERHRSPDRQQTH
jgi:hypothetical protein